MHKLLSEARTRLRYAFSILCLITFLGASADLFAEANYVYHEQTTANPGCGPNYMSTTTPNNGASVQLAWKVEYQFYTTNTVVYYTTDGTNPSGAFGVGTGTTQVLTGSYNCSFGSPVTDVATATIPVQAAGKTVKYIMSAWHSGGGDEIFANGPGAPCACGSVRNNSSLATVFTYTVAASTNVEVTATGGTALANYATIKAAFDAVNAGTHTGSITIKIYGNTTETATASLNASGAGSASYTAISVQPAGGAARTVSGAIVAGSPLIDLNGADNVTIDGLNSGGNALTISNTTASATSGTSTIRFQADAINNTVNRCSVLGSPSMAAGTNGGVIYFAAGAVSTGNDNNTISNCLIGPAGANLPTKGIFGNGSTGTTTLNNSGITINNNEIYDVFNAATSNYGLYISSGNTAWTITNNKIYQTAARTTTTGITIAGIYIANTTSADGFTITGNTIGYANNAGTGTYTINGAFTNTFYGIYISGISTATADIVSSNIISDIAFTTTSSGTTGGSFPFAGINISTSVSAITMNSNTIRNISFPGTGTGAYAGIDLNSSGTGTHTVNSNTVNNLSRTASGTLYGIRMSSPTTVTLNSNTITALALNNTTSTSSVYGIYGLSSSVNVTASGNTITNLTTTSTASATITAIREFGVSGNKVFQNNIINNLSAGGGTATIVGIHASASSSPNAMDISGNVINSISGAGTIYGIQQTSSSTTINIYKNKIYDLSGFGTGALVYGLNLTSGTTFNLYNNLIGDLKALTATGLNSVIGINASATSTYNVYYNNIYLNTTSTSATTFGTSCVTFSSTATAYNSRNNILINLSTPAQNGTNVATNGISAALRRSGGTTGTVPSNYSTTSNNNLYYVSPASGTNNHLTYVEGTSTITNPKNTVTDMKTFMVTRDQQSVEENSTFASTSGASSSFLHFAAATSTLAESAASNIATYTDDYDANTRQGNAGYTGTGSAPDIGADEFEGTNPSFVATSIGATALVTPATTGCFGATETVTITVKNYGTAILDFSVNPLTITTNVTGATTATLTRNVNTGTLAVGASTNYTMATTLNMSAAGVYTFNASATVTGDLNATDDAMAATTRTVVAPVSLPQTVNFTSYTGADLTTFFPNWSEATGATNPSGTTSGWTSSASIAGSGTTAKINLFSNTKNEWIVGPKFTATANTQLSYKIAITDFASSAVDPDKMTGTDDKVIVKISTDCGATYSNLVTYDATNTGAITNALVTQTQSLSAYAGQNVIIAFFGSEGTIDNLNDYDFHIDDINIQDVAPIDLGATALVTPAASGCFTATENISVSIKNYGTNNLDFSVTPASVTVNVTGVVTTSFTANLTSGTLLSGASMNVSMPSTLDMMTPGSYTFNAFTTIASDGVSANDAMTAASRTGSNPTATLASNSPVCEGNPINLTATSSGGNNIVSSNYTGSKTESPALAIPDGNVAGATSNITLAATGTVSASTAISVTVNISHAWMTDVDVYLVGPSNCGAMELTTDNGPSGTGSYTGTIFNTTLISPLITSGSSPFTGSYKPEGSVTTAPTSLSAAGAANYTSLPLVSLTGGSCPINGTWKLYVGDDVGSDIGTLSSWSLSITNPTTGNYTDAFSGTGTFGSTTYSGVSNSQGDVAVTAVADGSYTYSVTTTDANSCPSKPATTSVTVNNAATYYADSDGDTYGNPASTTTSCSGAPLGYVADNTDCNDGAAGVNPGATEICGNGIDDNCNGSTDEGCTLYTYYADADSDTYGDAASTTTNYTGITPAGYVTDNTDCNDANNAINPGATEICDGVDNDCDGNIDEGVLNTYYADNDADTYGDILSSTTACSAPMGYVANSTDCDDTNSAINPGATEICNSLDDDCDGSTDEGLTFSTYYADAEGDGFGDPASSVTACATPVGYVANNIDCQPLFITYADADGDFFGFGAPIPCGPVINNADCDDTQLLYADSDGDGFGAGPAIECGVPTNTDCAPFNNAIYPGATEICNGIDEDCDGTADDGVLNTYYADADGDTYGDAFSSTTACSTPVGYVSDATDCNDADDAINPAATEICNFVDDDCDGITDDGITYLIYYTDADNDNYGTGLGANYCSDPGLGYSDNNADCDDTNGSINPGATEICNGVDDDCNGDIDEGLTFVTYYADADADTHGDAAVSTTTCDGAPMGYVLSSDDCDDNDNSIYPGAIDLCNGIDNDCDGNIDEDALFTTYYVDNDGDTYGDQLDGGTTFCYVPAAPYVLDNTDCNDADASINPGATEICNAMDEDCDGIADDGLTFTTYYADADADTYGDAAVTTTTCDGAPMGYVIDDTDCDDTDGSINPGATEVCNAIDEDCDGIADDGLTFTTYYRDADGDTYGNAAVTTTTCDGAPVGYVIDDTDCDDSDASINPGATEICNAMDEDCDGIADDGLTFTTYYADADADTYGDAAVSTTTCDGAPVGYVIDDTDCDDSDASINPGATEICNAMDEDCDGIADDGLTFTTYYADADGDTHGDAAVSTTTCDGAPMGYVSNSDDCDDADDTVYPGVIDLCNGIDNDCDGNIDDDALFTTYYLDNDGDTYGDQLDGGTTFCYVPAAPYVLDNTDCNDADASINPGAAEICNAIDEDCDGIADDGLTFTTYFADTDADTYGDAFNTTTTCDGLPSGYVTDNTDCDDTQNTVYPGAAEICDGLDNDCDGNFDEGTVSASITPSGSVQTCKGVPTTLTANTGIGYTYQWFKNGNIIVGATASTYGANKPGNYQVQVNSPEGCFALSTPTVVSVLANPNANASAPNGTSLCTTVKLKVSYDATYTWQWKKDGTPIPGANNYLYFPTTAGSYTCLVTAATGCSRESNAIVVTACKEGEIVEPIAAETFDMFPNPTESEFVIELSVITNATSADVQLFNIMGEIVYNNNVSVNNGNISESITLNDAVPAGMYIVKVTVDGKEFTKQLILQK